MGTIDRLIEDIRNAETVEHARKIYENSILNGPMAPELSTALQKAEFRLVNTYDLVGTQAFLAVRDPGQPQKSYGEGIAVLSFRGTERDLRDVKTDLRAGKSMINGIPVHPGFWEAFKHVQSRIESDLRTLMDAGYSLYLTGHSLGGALALIATHEIGEDSTGACYTFGSPRVAGYGFAQDIKSQFTR